MTAIDVMEVCKQISEEAQAIQAYTASIAAATDKTVIGIFDEIRQDELEHLQKLTIALTDLLNGEEPDATAKMDDAQKPEDAAGTVIDKRGES